MTIQEIQFGLPQGRILGHPRFKVLIKTGHQLLCTLVIDLPERSGNAFGTGISKGPRQADDAFAALQLSRTGLAGREHHQVGVQLKIVQVTDVKQLIF